MQEKKPKKESISFLERVKTDKRSLYALYAILLLAALLFYFAGTGRFACRGGETKSEPAKPNVPAVDDDLEQRLIRVLSQIRGAGRVSVLITYETGTEIVTAMSSRTEEDIKDAVSGRESTTSKSVSSVVEPATVKTEGSQAPIVLMEREPVIRGVIVVAEGAADLQVRMNLLRAVQAATGASASQIEVFEMSYDS